MDILAVASFGILGFSILVVIANCIDYWTGIAHKAGEHIHPKANHKYGCCTREFTETIADFDVPVRRLP